MWTWSREWFRSKVTSELNKFVNRFPQHKVVAFANDPNDLSHLSGLDSRISKFVCGEFAATSPEIFSATCNQEPQFDAVVISRFEPYKRLELAALVDKVLIISRGLTEEKASEIEELIPRCTIGNRVDGKIRELGAAEVATLLSVSRCGLILSEVEGQNRATSEYLLSGLPVVTTPNIGGRDRLLNPTNSVYAEPTPKGIFQVVQYYKAQAMDREKIRSAAVDAIDTERRWLKRIIEMVAAEQGIALASDFEISLPHHGSSSSLGLSQYKSHF
jgi:glycosyltransferase involved in cell wall biosynthesis